MPNLEAAVATVADALAEKATGDWSRLIWRATLYRGGTFEERVELIPASGATPISPMALLRMGFVMNPAGRRAVEDLATALAATDDADRHAIELTVEPGRVEAVVSAALTQSTGHLPPTYQIVVDPTPPTASTEAAEPVVPQGNLGRTVELAETYASLYAEVMGERPALRPPATEEQIADAERALGVTLPPDLRALYRMADGEEGEYGLFGGPTFLPLEWMVERWQEGEPTRSEHVTVESDPPGVIRTETWHPRWIPFADHNDGNLFAVDLAPGPNGTAGQVIAYGRDHSDEPVALVAASVTDLLAELVDLLRAGDIDAEPGERLWVFPSYTRAETPPHNYDLTPAEQSIEDWVAALPDPARVQELWLRDAGSVDLSPVAALPRLRVLHLQKADEITGVHALRSRPLEKLTIDAGTVDLSELDGHPTLRILNLSGSRVTDIGAITRLPALRHLTLDADQWAQLRDDQVPDLATAGLTGTSSLRAACDWARRIVPTAPAPWHHGYTR